MSIVETRATHWQVLNECWPVPAMVMDISPWPVSPSAYRRSLAVSSTTISYSVYVVILGVCLRFKPHWMFQIYKYVKEGREELTSCSSLMHSHMFPLLDVLGISHLCSDVNTMRFRASVYHTNGSKQAMLSANCQRLVNGSLIGRSCDARHSRYLAI